MIEIAVCDDEKIFLDKILSYVAEVFDEIDIEYTLYVCETGEELLDIFFEKDIDIIISDIEIGKFNGFEAVEKIQQSNPKVEVIFVSSHNDLVYQSYIYHPFWFVRKNYIDEIKTALFDLAKKYINNPVCVKLEYDSIQIDLKKTKSIVSDGHYVVMHFENGTKRYRGKIKDCEEQLKGYHFVRIQKGILINMRFVEDMNSKTIILSTGEMFNIGRNRIDNVRHEFMQLKRSMIQ